MRGAAIPVVAMVGLQLLVPLAGASPAPQAAEAAFGDLKRSALADVEPERDPVERLRSEVLDGEREPALEQAWRRAQNASGTEARQAVGEAEAALLELVRDRVESALEEGDASRAEAWLAVALARADTPNRTIAGAGDSGEEAREEELREALAASLAVRARELAWKAFLLNATDRRAAAEATAAGAQAVTQLLAGNASRRLPDGERAAFETNASRVGEAVLGAAADADRYLFPGLAAGLTALQYDHDVEELEVLGQRPIDGAHVAQRAAREDPEVHRALAQAAFDRYAVDRARLGLMGEGTNDEVDEAYRDLRAAVRADDRAGLANATDRVREAVGDLALLGQGAVVTVESGGVRPDRTHRYDVSLVRPSLEGVGSYRLALGYDGDVLDVVNVSSVATEEPVAWEGGGTSGHVVVEVEGAEPIREAAHLFQLHLEAAGPPMSQTNLTVEDVELREPDGDPLTTFLLRDGNVTIAQIETGDAAGNATETSGDTGTEGRSTPAAGPAGLLLAGLLAAAGRRRR